MLRNILFFLGFFVLVGSASASFAGGLSKECEEKKQQIQKVINSETACKNDGDCSVLIGKCPFGCYLPLTKGSVGKVEASIGDFEKVCPACRMKCAAMEGKVACIENRCKITK